MYRKKWFFSLVLPAFLLFFFVVMLPTLLGIISSFTDWKLENQLFEDGWIGIKNYKSVFNDSRFLSSIGYTTVFTLISVLFVNIFGFCLALLLVKSFKGRNFFRGVFFIPNLIGGLVLGFLWKQIFDLVLPKIFGGESLRIHNRWTAMFSMAILISWQMSGFIMIIYIAALQNINNSLIEASKIEGQGIFRRLKTVIIPGVMPAITISLFLVLSNSFKMFDQNFALTEGKGGTDLLAMNIYKSAYDSSFMQTFGIAQAKAVIFTVLVSSIAISQVAFTKRFEVET